MTTTQSKEPKPAEGLPTGRAKRIGFVGWLLTRMLGMTLRVRYEGFEQIEQQTKVGGAILLTWHGRSLIPANVFRGRGYWVLISLSRDGEIQNEIFRRYGFQSIRGSTGKGGARALLQLTRKIKEGGVSALTPDGPRGPTHKVQPGSILVAQRSGYPIIPFATSARPRKLLSSWDSYLVPKPFARASFVVGAPIHVPAELTEEEQAAMCECVEEAINRCETRAEELLS